MALSTSKLLRTSKSACTTDCTACTGYEGRPAAAATGGTCVKASAANCFAGREYTGAQGGSPHAGLDG